MSRSIIMNVQMQCSQLEILFFKFFGGGKFLRTFLQFEQISIQYTFYNNNSESLLRTV